MAYCVGVVLLLSVVVIYLSMIWSEDSRYKEEG